MGNDYEQMYLETFRKILNRGKWVYNDRTGTRCLTIPRHVYEIELKSSTCPLLSVRPSYPVSAIAEMVNYKLGSRETLNKETFIIGGVSIYDQLNSYVDTAYITRIARDFPSADTYIDLNWLERFKVVDKRILNGYSWVEVYKRR